MALPLFRYNNVFRGVVILITLACATSTSALIYAATLPKGVNLSFTNFKSSSSVLNFSIDGLVCVCVCVTQKAIHINDKC